MSAKIEVVLSDEAMEVINRSASEHKRSEWISNAVVEYDRIASVLLPPHLIDDSMLERIDSRLAKVERHLAVLVQKAEQGRRRP